MKEDWTKQIKQKLEGHQMTPPAGLWEGISNEMNLEPKPAPKSAIIRRWYWAAAAAVLAIVGFFAFYQFDDSEPQLVANNEQTAVEKTANQPSAIEEKPIIEKPVITVSQKSTHLALTTRTHQAEPIETETNETEPMQEIAEENNLQETTEYQQQETPEATEAPVLATTEKKRTYLPDVVEPDVTSSKSEATSKWSLGLNGSNGLLMASNNYANDMNAITISRFYNDANYNGLSNSSFTSDLSDYSNSNIQNSVISKHHLPIRFGLSLQYQLNPSLALNSGISYSYLVSDFNMAYNQSNSYTQKLRYLGVPLGVSWKLWQTGGFSLYLTGGALIEKCISAYMSDDKMDSQPWQLSINASAGAEYHITRQFGLYLEPSLGYYFDDNSSIEHYYKEHPLAPSIQFGLRLYLK
jgi:hypothetical protein